MILVQVVAFRKGDRDILIDAEPIVALISASVIDTTAVVTNISNIGDVAGGACAGDVMVYDGSLWNPGQFPSATINDLSSIGDVVGNAGDSQILAWDCATSQWAPKTEYQNSDAWAAQGSSSFDPTGFFDPTKTIISMNDAIKTFSISASTTGLTYRVFQIGHNFEICEAVTYLITGTEGIHLLHFESGTIRSTGSFSNEVIRFAPTIASIYWDSDNSKTIYLGEERHRTTMDGDTHAYNHFTIGTRFLQGIALESITADGDGTANSQAQLGYATGFIIDEDILLVVPPKIIPANIPIFFRHSSTKWRRKDKDNYPMVWSDSATFTGANGLLAYNDANGGDWTLTEVATSKFVLTHFFAVNDINDRLFGILGQATYSTKAGARAGATTEINSLVTEGLPFLEFTPIATIILQTKTANSNQVKSTIVTTDEGADYVDFRNFRFSTPGTPSDHGSLGGLSDNDHPQYALLESNVLTNVSQGDLLSWDTSASAFINGAVISQSQTAITTKGDIVFFNSSCQSERLAIGSAGDILTVSGGLPVWRSAAAGGGGGGPSGGNYNDVFYGEDIGGGSQGKSTGLVQRQALFIEASNSWVDIEEAGGCAVAVQVITVSKHFQIADFGISSSEDLLNIFNCALSCQAALSSTYQLTFNTATTQFSISASLAFTIPLVSGTHVGITIFGNALGYNTSANKTGSATYLADKTIANAGTSAFVKRAYLYKIDTSYDDIGINFNAFIDENGVKGGTTTAAKQWQNISNFTDLIPGSQYFTLVASITIDNTNKFLNFFESGGAQLTASIARGVYLRGNIDEVNQGYSGLRAAIVTGMEATTGTFAYTATFDKYSVNKFGISSPCGTFSLPFGSGSSISTDIAETIGYCNASVFSATSHIADNVIDLAGEVGLSSNLRFNSNSQYAGKATKKDGTVLYTEFKDGEGYVPVLQIGESASWKSEISKDFGEDVQFVDEDQNSAGVAVRLVVTVASPATFKFQFKTGPGLGWQDASTTFLYTIGGAVGFTENFGGTYERRSLVFVDENGLMATALTRFNVSTGREEVWTVFSIDGGNNWSFGNGSAALQASASGDVNVGGLWIVQNKSVILSKHELDNDSKIHISDNTGFGYTSWSTTSLTNDFMENLPSWVFIQFFSEQAGINQYRIVAIGFRLTATTDIRAQYFLGDGTGEATVDIWPTLANISARSFGMDIAGLKNRICGLRGTNAAATLHQAESNEDYNGGTLTFNTHSVQDLNSGGSTLDGSNGYSSADGSNNKYIWNEKTRILLIGDYCYIVDQTNANAAGKAALMLFWTKDITTGVWETPINIGGAEHNQECAIQYMPTLTSFIVTYKYLPTATLANNLTNGQIFARLFKVDLADGTFTQFAAEQIDGGQLETGFQGYNKLSNALATSDASWERLNSATSYDELIHAGFN